MLLLQPGVLHTKFANDIVTAVNIYNLDGKLIIDRKNPFGNSLQASILTGFGIFLTFVSR